MLDAVLKELASAVIPGGVAVVAWALHWSDAVQVAEVAYLTWAVMVAHNLIVVYQTHTHKIKHRSPDV